MIVGVACKGVHCCHRQGTVSPVPATKRHSVLCNVKLSWKSDPTALGGRGDQSRSSTALSANWEAARPSVATSLLGLGTPPSFWGSEDETCLYISTGEDSTLGRDRRMTIIEARDHGKSMVEQSRVG